MEQNKENKLDVRKAFEALARIIGDRENVTITVKSIELKDKTQKDETA